MRIPLSHDLFLRPLSADDVSALQKLVSENRERLANAFPLMTGQVKDEISTIQYVKHKLREMKERVFYSFVIADQHAALLGYLSLKNVDWTVPKAEVAYYIDRSLEGKGITTQALDALCTYAFEEMGMNKLFLRVSPENPASRRVAEKCGFIMEGLLRSDFKRTDGKLIDVEYFGRVRGVKQL